MIITKKEQTSDLCQKTGCCRVVNLSHLFGGRLLFTALNVTLGRDGESQNTHLSMQNATTSARRFHVIQYVQILLSAQFLSVLITYTNNNTAPLPLQTFYFHSEKTHTNNHVDKINSKQTLMRCNDKPNNTRMKKRGKTKYPM